MNQTVSDGWANMSKKVMNQTVSDGLVFDSISVTENFSGFEENGHQEMSLSF